jgi:hydrogenase maturation protein HypF
VRLVRRAATGGEGAGDARASAAGAGAGDGVEVLAAGSEADPAGPVRAAAELLRVGEILAVKGLGGFHLACDATHGAVVRHLKELKRRPDKPLAVMFADLD